MLQTFALHSTHCRQWHTEEKDYPGMLPEYRRIGTVTFPNEPASYRTKNEYERKKHSRRFRLVLINRFGLKASALGHRFLVINKKVYCCLILHLLRAFRFGLVGVRLTISSLQH